MSQGYNSRNAIENHFSLGGVISLQLSFHLRPEVLSERFSEMLLYVVICVALAMAGVAGLQFFYLAYLERIGNQLKRRIQELERQNAVLYHRWQDAEHQLNSYQALDAEEIYEDEEVWSEIIED
jgi:hypothetical protein